MVDAPGQHFFGFVNSGACAWIEPTSQDLLHGYDNPIPNPSDTVLTQILTQITMDHPGRGWTRATGISRDCGMNGQPWTSVDWGSDICGTRGCGIVPR